MKHIVGFSGGVDSQACARWVLNRFPKEDVILTNSNAGGWEDPLTQEFVAAYSRDVHPITYCHALVKDMWETPGFAETRGLDGEAVLTMEGMIAIVGRAPAGGQQFCTKFLKLYPQRRWQREVFGVGGVFEGQDFVRYSGMRRDESKRRQNTAIEAFDDFYDCTVVSPLADWTKKMCFDYVQAHGEEINPLYRMGFGRVGCAPCINSSKEDVLNWAQRRPEMIDKVRGVEERTGTTFFSPREPGRINFIDDVVQWAHTKRGGKHLLLPMMVERDSCESKYGLCE